MYQVRLAYQGHSEWEVRAVSPAEFRQLDEADLKLCFWSRESAIKHAIRQNEFAMRQMREESADMEERLKQLRAELPTDSMRGVISLAEQAGADKSPD